MTGQGTRWDEPGLLKAIRLLEGQVLTARGRIGQLTQEFTVGRVVEEIPETEWCWWHRFVCALVRLLGRRHRPQRRRPMTQAERAALSQRIRGYEEEAAQVEERLRAARERAQVQVTRDSRECLTTGQLYPADWEAVSLSYRRAVGFICERCGAHEPDGHVHHRVPARSGGGSEESNLVFLCRSCHRLQHPHMRDA